jgi:NAD(P)-dependent dehydrogenase (short-subunit alcohol dehydrogenase family)
MPDRKSALVVGGTSGIGLGIALAMAERGDQVSITGRDPERTRRIAEETGRGIDALALDLAEPETLAERLAGVGPVDRLVLAAIERDANTVRDYSIARALRLVTLKLVGYTEVVHALVDRLTPDASILLMGGLAQARPYPGSLTVSTVNGGVVGMMRAMAVELAPIRVNTLHPAITGDTPAWADAPAAMLAGLRARTPTGRLVTTADVVGAALFLLDNPSANGVELTLDGGVLLK